MTKKYTQRVVTTQNRLLRKLCNQIHEIDYDGYKIELFHLHLHDPEFNSSTKHSHSCVEIHTIIAGSGSVTIGKKEYAFTKNQFTLTHPGQIHSWRATVTPLIMYVWLIRFSDQGESDSTETEQLFSKSFKAKRVVYSLPRSFEYTFEQMMEELKGSKQYCNMILLCQLKQLIILLARETIPQKNRRTTLYEDNIGKDRVVRIVEQFLVDNISKKLDLDTIAKHVSMSKRNLTRHYKKITGLTIGEKLHTVRMNTALNEIQETDLPIKSIALRCGIPDIAYFSKQIKQTFKYPPSCIRKKGR